MLNKNSVLQIDLAGILLAAILMISPSVAAQPNDPEIRQATPPLFASHLPLQVTIQAPLTTLTRDRPEEEYLHGLFTFTGDDGAARTVDLKIRTRGNYRRDEEHCDFPPIRLNLRTKQLVDSVFAGQDKLKVVTHCRSKNRHFEQLVLREFLAYRIFQVMTNKSYGVRLLQVNYVDTEGAKPMTKLAFAIEDDDDVARRVGMMSVNVPDIANEDLDRQQQNLVNVFQYLIGNTEFSLIRAEPDKYCCHNADLISATGGPPFTPLPYDFDFAGLVNAPYAQPNPRYDIRHVRHRLFRGLCSNNDLLMGTIQHYLDRKDAVYAIVDEIDMLTRGSRRYVTLYLNSFYKRISTPKKIDNAFVKRCE
ncbi:MAG: hypothetical protein KJO01_13315 [Gammaproteobacteria bacterium]|nr:hypothetical protein [Gammaproteobacteria bacterium]NNL44302.1 hypothetical protein [Woeseiaceae bacterium]